MDMTIAYNKCGRNATTTWAKYGEKSQKGMFELVYERTPENLTNGCVTQEEGPFAKTRRNTLMRVAMAA